MFSSNLISLCYNYGFCRVWPVLMSEPHLKSEAKDVLILPHFGVVAPTRGVIERFIIALVSHSNQKSDVCLGQRRSGYWLNVWLAPHPPRGFWYHRIGKRWMCQHTVHHRASGTCSLPTGLHLNTFILVINKTLLWECNLTSAMQ